jgi:hypothetical protein
MSRQSIFNPGEEFFLIIDGVACPEINDAVMIRQNLFNHLGLKGLAIA